ncbi:MAG TPA: energy transducer TonB [Pyrinomonadaceae bacterium]|jgi:protein TonB|nr:energy transducer TonB [Pyrinomonadaceae bacterium]
MNSERLRSACFCFLVTAILAGSSFTYSQSGRRAKQIPTTPSPTPEAKETAAKPAAPDPPPPQVTAEKNQDYRCTDDGSLARIIEADDIEEVVVSPKEADVRATISAKPKPSYTKEARRNGIQGFVTLKVLLSARGKVSRVRVVKGLPAGLTENAIRAACKMEFKPAMKNGKTVSEWLNAEYVFRLADSSIFTP